MRPEIKVLAVSNVYTRLMHFLKTGDQELGHYHPYDHGTLLSSGKLLVEKVDHKGNIIFSKEFVAPTFIMIEKDSKHILTALEDNTVAGCIHALRDETDEIVSPEFILDETVFADSQEQIKDGVIEVGRYFNERGMHYKPLAFEKVRIIYEP